MFLSKENVPVNGNRGHRYPFLDAAHWRGVPRSVRHHTGRVLLRMVLWRVGVSQSDGLRVDGLSRRERLYGSAYPRAFVWADEAAHVASATRSPQAEVTSQNEWNKLPHLTLVDDAASSLADVRTFLS